MILTNRSNIWGIIMVASAGPAPHILHWIAVLIADATNILFCNYGTILCTLGGYKMYVEFATAFVFVCKMWTHDPWNPSQRTESYPSNPERPVINEAAEPSLKIHTNLLTRCRQCTYSRTSKIRNQNTATTFYAPYPPTTRVTLHSLNNFCRRCNKYYPTKHTDCILLYVYAPVHIRCYNYISYYDVELNCNYPLLRPAMEHGMLPLPVVSYRIVS